MWILSIFYCTFGQIPVVQAAFEFLKPAVVAIVAGALVKIGTKSLLTVWHCAVAITAFAAIYFLNVPFPAILFGAILIGAAAYFARGHLAGHSELTGMSNDEEHRYHINAHSPRGGGKWSHWRLQRQIGVALVLWCIPILLLYVYSSNFTFWKSLAFFFTKAALVTFGGAYAVLPYVAQVSVEQFNWLTRPEMLDGLALGETTPGPLIIVLAFVGFMAGFNTFGGSILAATIGLLLTVWYTFLPSFLFVLAGAPIIESTHSNQAVKSILQYVSAAVVGVILNLCLYLGVAVIAPQPPEVQWLPLAWVVISLVAMHYFKTNLIAWIGISVLFGLGRYLLC